MVPACDIRTARRTSTGYMATDVTKPDANVAANALPCSAAGSSTAPNVPGIARAAVGRCAREAEVLAAPTSCGGNRPAQLAVCESMRVPRRAKVPAKSVLATSSEFASAQKLSLDR